MTHILIGRIAGIPVFLDMFFVLVLILFSHDYFASGDTQVMSAGLVIIAGIMISILLHELGHAFAGRLFKAEVSQIELTALGGYAQFERSLPNSVIAKSVIFLGGPAVTLALSYGFLELAHAAAGGNNAMLAGTFSTLSGINMQLFIFNMLPAFPLDGGRTLDAWLGPLLGSDWAIRIVAGFGLLIAAWLAFTALPANFFRLFLAFFLFQANWQALEIVGGWGGRR